ncbi:hypothetical protein LZ009_07115 [Ramlibacter sp. XY19]|uniref:hypothetical protein n=1 Tax=Ramlibacter paludis TaxID=2908000 RepID=UPI0023DA974E|nr:hypothetical protein [Ramlibacter paludis]MCG2592551.1 hypothetical protein [Ramlibacter paludis]
MAELFRRTHVWIVDFRYEGRPRTWYKPLPQGTDAGAAMAALLRDWYGDKAQLVGVRPATEAEELQYIRGETLKNLLCPTGRAPRS